MLPMQSAAFTSAVDDLDAGQAAASTMSRLTRAFVRAAVAVMALAAGSAYADGLLIDPASAASGLSFRVAPRRR